MSQYQDFSDLLGRVSPKKDGQVNQSEMARLTGLARTTIGTWVRGEVLPTIPHWETLSEWLDARVKNDQADATEVKALRREFERHDRSRTAHRTDAGHRLARSEAPSPRDWRDRLERHLVRNEARALPTVLPWERFERDALRLPLPRSGFPDHIPRRCDDDLEAAVKAAHQAFEGRLRLVVITSDTGGTPPCPGTSSNSGLTHAALHAIAASCMGAGLLAIKNPSSPSALDEFTDAYRDATAKGGW